MKKKYLIDEFGEKFSPITTGDSIEINDNPLPNIIGDVTATLNTKIDEILINGNSENVVRTNNTVDLQLNKIKPTETTEDLSFSGSMEEVQEFVNNLPEKILHNVELTITSNPALKSLIIQDKLYYTTGRIKINAGSEAVGLSNVQTPVKIISAQMVFISNCDNVKCDSTVEGIIEAENCNYLLINILDNNPLINLISTTTDIFGKNNTTDISIENSIVKLHNGTYNITGDGYQIFKSNNTIVNNEGSGFVISDEKLDKLKIHDAIDPDNPISKSQLDIVTNNLNTKIDDIEIGGTNLYSINSSISGWVETPPYESISVTRNSFNGIDAVGKNTGLSTIRIGKVINNLGLYTISFKSKVAVSSVNLTAQINDQYSQNVKLTTDWQKFILYFNVTSNIGDVYNFFQLKGLNFQHLYIRDLKIESGNKATDWSPAPEDLISGVKLNGQQLVPSGGVVDVAAVPITSGFYGNVPWVDSPSGFDVLTQFNSTRRFYVPAYVSAANAPNPNMSFTYDVERVSEKYMRITATAVVGSQNRHLKYTGTVDNGIWYGWKEVLTEANIGTSVAPAQERGTWTPRLAGLDGGSLNYGDFTYQTKTGRYILDGKMITITFMITVSFKTKPTGQIVIVDIPNAPGFDNVELGLASIGYIPSDIIPYYHPLTSPSAIAISKMRTDNWQAPLIWQHMKIPELTYFTMHGQLTYEIK